MPTAAATLRTFLTEVVDVRPLGPQLVQVTFGGGDLGTFAPVGPDTFLYLLLPPPGRDALTIDQGFTWEACARMPEAERPVGAYYTLRGWRPGVAELDVWMVLHDDPGHAAGWALRASPGDPVALWGPRTAFAPPDGTDRYLLVADETGLPAVAGILEWVPADVPVHVVAEAADPAAWPALPAHPSATVTWLDRSGAPPGRTSLLADAVGALDLELDARTYVWGGAESRAMTAVRRHVRDERGLAREQVSLVAYWRHRDHPVDDDPDD